jgi:hypothetical protein
MVFEQEKLLWMLSFGLYQGTTLVGPQRIERELGFSPC